MKEIYLDTHTIQCIARQKYEENNNMFNAHFCDLNPVHFLFYLGTEFYMISYNRCLSDYEHIDFKKELINEIIEKNKIFKYYEVNKSVKIDYDLKEFRLRQRPLKKYIQETNYVYSDNARNIYAITTLVKYTELLSNLEQIKKNYLVAKEIITQNYNHSFLDDLDKLYYQNTQYFNEIGGRTVANVKTINELIKQVKQNP